MCLKEKVSKIIEILKNEYPNAKCMLDYETPLDLLVATILAAQCTDERVNIVTKTLFKQYKNASDYGNANKDELISIIRSTGFFNNKANSIIETGKVLVEKFNGIVPKTIEELITLPGVGRKTANVVSGSCFNKPAIIVDTHFKRLMDRIGLSKSTDPDKIEIDLKNLVIEKDQTLFSHLITSHGRKICNAKKPLCTLCVISYLCDYNNTK